MGLQFVDGLWKCDTHEYATHDEVWAKRGCPWCALEAAESDYETLVEQHFAMCESADVQIEAAEAERDEARAERDLAIAHDRQPYPTAWAYEQACRALTEAQATIRKLTKGEAMSECDHDWHDAGEARKLHHLADPVSRVYDTYYEEIFKVFVCPKCDQKKRVKIGRTREKAYR